MPAGLCPAAPLVDIAAWLRYGATLLTFCRCAVLARLPARLSYGFSSRCWRLGEVVRSSLVGLALWWLEHPGTPAPFLSPPWSGSPAA